MGRASVSGIVEILHAGQTIWRSAAGKTYPVPAALIGLNLDAHIGESEASMKSSFLIAATALAHGLPLVGLNERHFGRVPGLQVLAY